MPDQLPIAPHLRIKKVLIANRGEIAIRIIRACHELNMEAVSVYSDVDADMPHVRMAEQSVRIGPAAASESYLNIEKIIAAAREAGAQAVHPGYGFLSENADFAEAIGNAGLTFIGPTTSAIRAMGDKTEAKIRMRQAGVPVVPGFENLETNGDFLSAAEQIGYPVLIKASAGGGGKGMRIVHHGNEMVSSIEAARREALNSFGSDGLLIEKYIEHARHIEFQVFGDSFGNLVHLFERECSIQRRHQKIIEETPSPLLDSTLRSRMGAAAITTARAVNYSNAGTVEFVVDPLTHDFYFLEMNTRIQVEHPITEAVTGLDLVQWQLRVAAGEVFPYKQKNLVQKGHAVECRLYAEDPANNFLPQTGNLLRLTAPSGPGIRFDTGVETGSKITSFYDPMLAKLIVHAENRPAALRRMEAALRETIIHGLITNVDFLQDLLAQPDFQTGNVTTSWIEKHFAGWTRPEEPPTAALFAAALASEASTTAKHAQYPKLADLNTENDPYSPWKLKNNFRN